MSSTILPDQPPDARSASVPAAATSPEALISSSRQDTARVYALPAPIRTFPLPVFYPSNPLSLLHLVSAWLRQAIFPVTEPAVVHRGVWDPSTGSVHVVDEQSARALWEQGFYGKGSLSRSEPNWLKREQVRRGLARGHVDEIHTMQRREERQKAKWERAKSEQEAIRLTKLREELEQAGRSADKPEPEPPSGGNCSDKSQWPESPAAPVGPYEILALPNSLSDLASRSPTPSPPPPALPPPLPPLGFAAGPVVGSGVTKNARMPSEPSESRRAELTQSLPGRPEHQKSVKFSPTVDPTNLEQHTDTPGTDRGPVPASSPVAELTVRLGKPDGSPAAIVNKEHLQLMPEEAFFLAFALGVLVVVNPGMGEVIPTRDLLGLLGRYSSFPPRPESSLLQPDNSFLVHYAVYHHFRSLGWVPRAGIKFGVDWLLYNRGPVFDHAEFGLVVIPSFSDTWWTAAGRAAARISWHWLFGVGRVLSHAQKSLVLVYVDVPPPPRFDETLRMQGAAGVVRLYRIREVMMRRWSSNRNRAR